jgi:Na+/H+ antiporter NhaB
LPFWQASVLALLTVYMVPLIAGAYVASYGGRMIMPGVPLALILAVIGYGQFVPGLVPPDEPAV